MSEPRKIGVVIGRFQPLHAGHLALIKTAMRDSDEVVILVGDTGGPRTFRNPFTFEERQRMLNNSVRTEKPFYIRQLLDVPYSDNDWKKSVEDKVATAVGPFKDDAITLFGHFKEDTNYLKWFPDWTLVPVPQAGDTDATSIRRSLFGVRGSIVSLLDLAVEKRTITNGTAGVIGNIPVAAFAQLISERYAIDQFNEDWTCAATDKYGPVVQCAVDACVVTLDNEVLLIERGGAVGRGQLALPGGFMNQGERLYDAALRELKEETGLDLVTQHKDTWACERRNVAFDGPSRSQRGRIVTHASLFKLKEKLPVTASDDAKAALWVPLTELPRERMFSDHWHIINMLTKGETP
jgi:bifunctional NMN adenylyltransferase/nudix hydrolase